MVPATHSAGASLDAQLMMLLRLHSPAQRDVSQARQGGIRLVDFPSKTSSASTEYKEWAGKPGHSVDKKLS